MPATALTSGCVRALGGFLAEESELLRRDVLEALPAIVAVGALTEEDPLSYLLPGLERLVVEEDDGPCRAVLEEWRVPLRAVGVLTRAVERMAGAKGDQVLEVGGLLAEAASSCAVILALDATGACCVCSARNPFPFPRSVVEAGGGLGVGLDAELVRVGGAKCTVREALPLLARMAQRLGALAPSQRPSGTERSARSPQVAWARRC